MAGTANISFDLTGDKQLMQKLDRLSKKIGRRVLRKAMREAAKPIVQSAKSHVPVETRGLKRSIGTRFKFYGNTGTEVAVIGPRIRYKKEKGADGKRRLVRDAKGRRITVLAGQHGYIVEFGTQPRYTKQGAFRGIGPAQPFMRPAWDSQKSTALKLAIRRLRKEVEAEARRGG